MNFKMFPLSVRIDILTELISFVVSVGAHGHTSALAVIRRSLVWGPMHRHTRASDADGCLHREARLRRQGKPLLLFANGRDDCLPLALAT